MMKCEMNTKNI